MVDFQKPAWSDVAADLRTVALLNPPLALMLAQGQPMAPRSYRIDLTFTAATPNVPIQGRMAERMYQDAWIKEMTYTVRRPQAYTNSLLKLEMDNYCKLNPYVDVELQITGPDRKLTTEGYVPLENICSTADAPRTLLDRGWTILDNQNLLVNALLTRTLDENEELPYEVVLTLNVLELSGCNLRTVGFDEAVCALKEMGLRQR